MLALVVTTVDVHTASTPDGVNLVDEDNARRILLRIFKEVTHPRRANAYKHLYKVRTGNAEKRYLCLARYRFSEVRFTRSGWPHHQDAVRDACAQGVKLAGIFEKLHHFEEVIFSLFNACHIFKKRLRVLFGDHAGFRLAELHRAVAAAAHPAHQVPQKADHEENRQ